MSAAPVLLQKFLPAWDLPDFSPFCFKAEVYLKLAGIPYTTELADSRKAPKNKLPVLVDSGRTIADSSAIIEHLERTREKPLDSALTPRQRAIATAVRAMLEEKLYFVIVYERWKLDANWAIYKPQFKELAVRLGVPSLLHGIVLAQVRKQMLTALQGQGIGRHTPDEIVAMAKSILDAVAELCEGPYFFGAQPTTLDATVYAFVQSILGAPFEGPIKEHAQRCAKLRPYCEHMQARCR